MLILCILNIPFMLDFIINSISITDKVLNSLKSNKSNKTFNLLTQKLILNNYIVFYF